mmetsp:Transcript_39208/g.47775  ORF Transcript_39208/g.47775 Transcript_39208/m.47775 type:complete len:83 (-) Transcript_39208:487-735(-)
MTCCASASPPSLLVSLIAAAAAAGAPTHPSSVYKTPMTTQAVISEFAAWLEFWELQDRAGAVTTNAKLNNVGPTASNGRGPT